VVVLDGSSPSLAVTATLQDVTGSHVIDLRYGQDGSLLVLYASGALVLYGPDEKKKAAFAVPSNAGEGA
jgi:hypothetical protein